MYVFKLPWINLSESSGLVHFHPTHRLMHVDAFSRPWKCIVSQFNGKSQFRLQIKMERAVLTFFFGALPVRVLHQHFMVQHFQCFFFPPFPYVWNFSRLLCKAVLCLSVTGETAVRPNEECERHSISGDWDPRREQDVRGQAVVCGEEVPRCQLEVHARLLPMTR